MKRIATFAVVLGLAAMVVAQTVTIPENAFGILAPPDWTPSVTTDPNPDVVVTSWFTDENGVTILDGVFVGPLLPNELRVIDASQYVGTGKTVCINATVERVGQPETSVTAVPVCNTFPQAALVPPTLYFGPQ